MVIMIITILASLTGCRLTDIDDVYSMADIEDEKNEDGHSVNPSEEKPKKRKRGPHIKERGKNEPFYGIGMIEFKKRFVEILDYYVAISTNKASKMEYYNDIMNNLDKVFC